MVKKGKTNRGSNGTISPSRVGVPSYVTKHRERLREAHKIAVDYVQGRDKKIADDALILSKRSGITYEEAESMLVRAWAEQEQAEGAARKVRGLALGYNEGAILDMANERLNPKRDPFAGLFGGKK